MEMGEALERVLISAKDQLGENPSYSQGSENEKLQNAINTVEDFMENNFEKD